MVNGAIYAGNLEAYGKPLGARQLFCAGMPAERAVFLLAASLEALMQPDAPGTGI